MAIGNRQRKTRSENVIFAGPAVRMVPALGIRRKKKLEPQKKNFPKIFLNFLDLVLRRTKTRQISRMGRLLTHLTSVGDLGFSQCCSAWRSSPACTRKHPRPHPPTPARTCLHPITSWALETSKQTCENKLDVCVCEQARSNAGLFCL